MENVEQRKAVQDLHPDPVVPHHVLRLLQHAFTENFAAWEAQVETARDGDDFGEVPAAWLGRARGSPPDQQVLDSPGVGRFVD